MTTYNLFFILYSNDEGFGDKMQYIVILAMVLGIIALVRGTALMKEVRSHWHHTFDTPPFSPQEFYQTIEEKIREKEVKGIEFGRVTYAQGGLLSPKREYMRVKYREFLYDICAAPFAKGFFVSWWLGEVGNPIADFFVNLPIVGKFFKRRKKTFFELDTEVIFKEIVSSTIKEVVTKLGEAKGIRQLTEAEWKTYERAY